MKKQKYDSQPLHLPEEIYYEDNIGYEGEEAYEFFLSDCLEKVFPNQRPERWAEDTLYVLAGEKPAVLLVYTYHPGKKRPYHRSDFTLTVEGGPVPARIRTVELIASDYPAHESVDEDYLTVQPGLFPDLLKPLEGKLRPMPNQYRAVWIDFPETEGAVPGSYEISLELRTDEIIETNGMKIINPKAGVSYKKLKFYMQVGKGRLKKQELLHTEWFYADCLSDYYKVSVFGEEHWRIVENYIAFAGKEAGMNVLLTPVFTPPVNTAVNGERPTVQLVDIYLEKGVYRFEYEKLRRWCRICKEHGITHLEIAHLFTQWGAFATPKIVAVTENGTERIFGWDMPAGSPEYREFLVAFIPPLREELEDCGYDRKHVFFHISDEPMEFFHSESYKTARGQLSGLLEEDVLIDALSDYSFYEKGVISHPVPGTNHATVFMEKKVKNLWVYYCTAQGLFVPNRFCAMPSSRNRIMGMLMYANDIKGFLHWGYNFYYDEYSEKLLDPFWETTAGQAFPAGDSYLVYPGPGGIPWSSIRTEVQRQGLDDMRALQLLESVKGRDYVLELIRMLAGEIPEFVGYPQGKTFLHDLHRKLFEEIENS